MSIDADSTVVVVGASVAGMRAAETLRAEGHRGPVVVVGDESELPYDRPPLSKQFLAGRWGPDKIRLRSREKIDCLQLDMRLGIAARALDMEERSVVLADGSRLRYGGLVLATGARPRNLPGAGATAGVHTLRTLADASAIASHLEEPEARVVVVGAGFIGAEVAATCHARGAQVTIVEALDFPLQRVLGEEMGAACAELHAQNGVALRTGSGVSGIRRGPDGKLIGVELESGPRAGADDGLELVEADVAVVGIGVEPATAWLEGSGLELRDGVVADSRLFCAPNVVVAGDVARWHDERAGEEIRIEHWTNAAEQGVAAAKNLLAGPAHSQVYGPVPYFWSDQYDTKIQMIGRPDAGDEVVVVDGSVAEGRFVALYGRRGRLVAVLGFSRPRQLMSYHRLLAKGASFDEALAHVPE